jgi:UDPglucose 6-dehydrogenase
MEISVYGAGFAGLTTAACLSNLGHNVICIDIDKEKINLLREGKIPFFEPGLQELVEKNQLHGNLKFSSDGEDGLNSKIIFNCVGTPSKENGSANLNYIFQVVNLLSKKKSYGVLVNKSTVPPGTAKECQSKLSNVEVVSNPEFLKEGSSVHDFTHPDKIVIGGKSERAKKLLKEVYKGLDKPYLKILDTSWETAEIIKYANNSFLATKISFINEIANICEVAGGDVKEVSKALGMDYRISSKFLDAGIGYGGFCFPKDVRALVDTAKKRGYEAKLLNEVNEVNERQKKVIISKIRDNFHSVKEKTFTIWGLAFKPKTSDVREAVSLVIIKELLKMGVNVKVYDPVAIKEVKKIFGNCVVYCNSLSESVKNSSGVIVATEWDEFREVDFLEIGNLMDERYVFDGRNIYEPRLVRDAGFEYFGVGR